MNMKVVDVAIKGLPPLMQHRFSENAEVEGKKTTRTVVRVAETPREEADKVCYRNKEGEYYMPSTCIHRMLIEAGSNHKLKGSRKSAKYVVSGAVQMTTDTLIVRNGDGVSPAKDYEVDSRPVVIPSTKGRIMRHRPRFDEWSMRFSLRVNEDLLPEDFVHQLLDEGGLQGGIGDFRPQKFGPFGTFLVTEWKDGKPAS